MKDSTTDARHYPRFTVSEYGSTYLPGQTEPVRTVVVNVGLRGMQLRSKCPLPVGEVCIVQEDGTDEGPLKVRGEVVYSSRIADSDMYLSGLRFLPADHEERQAIAEYVLIVFQRQGERASSPKPLEL